MMPVKFGQVYKSLKDVNIGGIVIYSAAGSGGFKAVIPKNTYIVLTNDPPEGAKGVYALPLNYKELEGKIVPEKELKEPMYYNYGLVVFLDSLHNDFSLEKNKEVKFDDAFIEKEFKRMSMY